MSTKTPSGFETQVGLKSTFDLNLPQTDGTFAGNGVSAFTAFEFATNNIANDINQIISIFQNPSEDIFNFTGINSGTHIILSDLHGQSLMIVTAVSEPSIQLDLTGYQPGVYFIKIEQNGNTIFRKIVLK